MNRPRPLLQSTGPALKVKHALADKLVFSKVRARNGGRLKFFESGGAPQTAPPADAGVVTIDGRDITHLPMHQRAQAGIDEVFVLSNMTIQVYELPKGSIVIGAGNRAVDNALARPMASALVNRMVHVHLTASARDWLAWARENGIHFIAGGHYATETFGVRRLGELVAERFGVEHRFIDAPNPI